MADVLGQEVVGPVLRIPYEIWDLILSRPSLDHRDVLRFGATCTRLHLASEGNEVWKTKYKQRWPKLFSEYTNVHQVDWRQEFKCRIFNGQEVRRVVATMSPQFFQLEEISKADFAPFEAMVEQHQFGYSQLMDELMSILNDGHSNANLTPKYYAQKVIRHVQHIHLTKEWAHFLALPPGEQTTLYGAVLVARWCQPTLDASCAGLQKFVDDVVERVREEVRQRKPDHPLLLQCDSTAASNSSRWSSSNCRVILECLNCVLYQQMEFSGNYDDYYIPENSYINKVVELRKGIPITLCILYEAVARQLGVHLEPVNFPSHFILRWEEHPNLPGLQKYTYVDAYDDGKLLSEKQCERLCNSRPSPESYAAVGAVQVCERMARNLIHVGRQQENMGDGLTSLWDALQMQLILEPDDLDSILLLSRVYMHLNINLEEVVENMQNFQQNQLEGSSMMDHVIHACTEQMKIMQQEREEGLKIQPKTRESEAEKAVRFAVGLIMKHKRYNYTCVIFGWDTRCTASQEWILRMGVNRLPKKGEQPFYNVLVEDGSTRYAAQENLEVATPPMQVHHPVLGRYFDTFRGCHYLPNKEKAQEYPNDAMLRQEIVSLYYDENDPGLE